MTYAFTVPGPPRGKGRPRFDSRSGRVFTPSDTVAYERTVAAHARLVMGPPSAFPPGPVEVEVLAVGPRPQKLHRKADPDGLLWRQAKPDADNVLKVVLDALKPWFDDMRVVKLSALSTYAEKRGEPRVEVRVGIVEGLQVSA
jgi:Holliday junction resolvase RusA-like endonuclease